MKITVLGSATTTPLAIAQNYRYPACHLIETNGYRILFDCGIGALPQLYRLGLLATDINFICITHYHADHFNIEPFLQALYVFHVTYGTESKLTILGPSDIEERVRNSYRLKGFSFDNDLAKCVDFNFIPYSDRQELELIDGVMLKAFHTPHYDLEAYSLRLESGGKTLTYSGDTSPSSAINEAARESDLFLCECGDDHKGQDEGHLSPEQVGLLARDSRCNHLAIVHYSGARTNQEIEHGIRSEGYSEELTICNDLDSFRL